jgi:hypothetical protein
MTSENQESVQLLNTAIIKSKEKRINISYEERLSKACENPAIKAIDHAIAMLSETEKISRDQAAIQIIETVRDLDGVWTDFLMMEGITKTKELLKSREQH